VSSKYVNQQHKHHFNNSHNDYVTLLGLQTLQMWSFVFFSHKQYHLIFSKKKQHFRQTKL